MTPALMLGNGSESLNRRFAELRPRSVRLLERAVASMPNGVPTSWMATLYDHPPMVVDRGSGGRFTDIDGNTYTGHSAGTDDVRWADRAGGKLYIVDNKANTVYLVTGPFRAGRAFASLDTVGTTAVTTQVDTINLSTGALTPFATGLRTAKGLLWVPATG